MDRRLPGQRVTEYVFVVPGIQIDPDGNVLRGLGRDRRGWVGIDGDLCF